MLYSAQQSAAFCEDSRSVKSRFEPCIARHFPLTASFPGAVRVGTGHADSPDFSHGARASCDPCGCGKTGRRPRPLRRMDVTKIGLYGGSFDPIHLGHLLAARAALEEIGLDKVCFLPAARSPFKQGAPPTAGPLRLRMLRLALAGNPMFEVDSLEIDRGGVSYSIDTLRDYAGRFPGAEFHFLIGADHVRQLPEWHEAAELAARTRFVVIPRPGQDAPDLPAPFQGVVLRGFPLALSSSQIRERVRAGLPVDGLVPPPVAEAIQNNRLYL
jgi:nicotinate-nucleotide adenylyltransferase